ncbi:hypothetical protein DAPK24_019750 [Pichia kluyveri]|uniref:Uncharacterized protein n=1 Tax=Pichia kluyveri TaxID=36015 RepID=A0AAV5R1U6_PICKL|nr:hypothetical protein DAPK24_019750 [Pichia kluyveri]
MSTLMFSPSYDINLNYTKRTVYSESQFFHDGIVSRVIYIGDVFRFITGLTGYLKKYSGNTTYKHPSVAFLEWITNSPWKISAVTKEHGARMTALEEDYKLNVNLLFFHRFLAVCPILGPRERRESSISLKTFMERSDMFNFKFTNDGFCTKTSYFGMREAVFLKLFSKMYAPYFKNKHNKVSSLLLPVDEIIQSDVSFVFIKHNE